MITVLISYVQCIDGPLQKNFTSKSKTITQGVDAYYNSSVDYFENFVYPKEIEFQINP